MIRRNSYGPIFLRKYRVLRKKTFVFVQFGRSFVPRKWVSARRIRLFSPSNEKGPEISKILDLVISIKALALIQGFLC